MSWSRIAVSAAMLWLSLSVPAANAAQPMERDSGEWGPYKVLLPDGEFRGLVFLFSPAAGIGDEEREAAAALARRGAAVALLDTAIYLARNGQTLAPGERGGCLDVPGALLWTSHYLQKELGVREYRLPVVAGRGEGAALAYVALAQAPRQTLAGGVSVDLPNTLPVGRALCQIDTRVIDGRQILGAYRLSAKWRAVGALSWAGERGALARAAYSLNGWSWPDQADPRQGFAQSFQEIVAPWLETDTQPPIPVVEVSPASGRRLLAVIYSGDGGWRDIEKTLGDFLKERDIAVLGVDALSYFWDRRSPQEVAGDLGLLLDRYRSAWGMEQVVLIGYSFGADVLPFAYNGLSPEQRRSVRMLGLIAPGKATDFEVRITGWLGAGPGEHALPLAPQVASIDRGALVCVYGLDEAADSLCTDAAASGAEIVALPGGHQFDGAYDRLGALLLEAIERRLPIRAGGQQ